MNNSPVRVRFAPSPTGMMHLGNVRTALMNYLFAKKYNGTFVLRIEDTDQTRNFDPEAKHIIADLNWLQLIYTEGPIKGGPHEPYYQSQRNNLYQEKLEELIKKNLVYRCFCSTQELEIKRQRQISLKQAPRYDRTCLKLPHDDLEKKIQSESPFIWRMTLDQTRTITITDLAHGKTSFNFQHFSDFPLSRQDGTFTFMFANFVDDLMMKITHVLRGEDHLSNTAGQAALYEAFNAPLPTFWHLPIIANIEGKKLSKRDFGFSLNDLRNEGFLPEAIDNYLGILGASFAQEIMSLDTLAKSINFESIQAKGMIKYDPEKLRWLNHKWICQLNQSDLANRSRPFIEKSFPDAKKLSNQALELLIATIVSDLTTLNDASEALKFYFVRPDLTKSSFMSHITIEEYKTISTFINGEMSSINSPQTYLDNLKKRCKEQAIDLKSLFCFLRLCLTGAPKGPGIIDLITMLGTEESVRRLEYGSQVPD